MYSRVIRLEIWNIFQKVLVQVETLADMYFLGIVYFATVQYTDYERLMKPFFIEI